MIPKSNLYLLLVFSSVLAGLTIWSATSEQNFYLLDILYGNDVVSIERLKQRDNAVLKWQKDITFHQKKGNYYLKGEVNLTTRSTQEHLGFLIVMQASYVVYWDNILIGHNGKVGYSSESEIPGKMNHTFIVPKALAQRGKHKVLLKLSNHHTPSPNGFRLMMAGNYDQLTQRPLVFTAALYILAGSFITIAIYYLLLYLIAYRQTSVLIFALLSAVFCVLTLFEHSKPIYQYLYPWHHTRLLIVELLSYIIAYLIVLFFLVRFQTPHKALILILLTILLVWMDILNLAPEDVFYMYIISLFMALLIIIRAMWQKRKGSLEAFSGILACFLSLNYYDLTLFLGFFGLVIFMLISLSVQLKEQKHAEGQALLRSGRLEIELLKKQLQPHFLMNTLTSIIGWIEVEPKTSVELIEALAKELDILLEIAPKKLIPLSQEIALCQSHMAVMRYRKNIIYALEVHLIDETALIPPAIFHTLLENGISHSETGQGSVSFYLTQEKNKASLRYTFVSKYKKVPAKSQDGSKKTEGTGHRYIKARLEESFARRWIFFSEASPDGWKDVIEIE